MKNDLLKNLQAEEFKILKEFKRVCEKYNISYILSSGTLLGAIRHKGFIPWDDDIDVDMTRENYELFLKHADELSDDYYIQNWNNDNEFGLPFSKIRAKGTICRENKCKNMKNNGIYIDIFPCDKFNYSIDNRKYFKTLNNLRFAILLKSTVYEIFQGSKIQRFFKRLTYNIMYFTLIIQSREKLIDKYEELVRNNQKQLDGYKYFENGGANKIGVWILEREHFDDTISVPFENDYFNVPKDYDLCLKSTYGDYMKLPPEDKRRNRHDIIELKFKD